MIQRQRAGIEDWDNEGGAIPPVAAPRTRVQGESGLPRHRRSTRDTVAGCRASAGADLLQAASMDTVNGRLRFEHSAASWTARGDLLQRLDEGWRTRTAK